MVLTYLVIICKSRKHNLVQRYVAGGGGGGWGGGGGGGGEGGNEKEKKCCSWKASTCSV